jgi:hypothetical protein
LVTHKSCKKEITPLIYQSILTIKAILIARELGLNKAKAITDLVVTYTSSSASSAFKERFHRNIERTWLAAFFAEKSFGIVTGRVMNVGRSEISESISEWWAKPMACPFDRVISGVVEMRILLVSHGSDDA